MILKVNKDICEIKQNEVWNVGDYNVHTVQVELSEEFDGLVNKVRFFVEDNNYDMLITDNVAEVPREATLTEGIIRIGVYGYDADTDILVQSTSPVNKYIASGTYTGEADNTEPLTPTDKQQMETAIQKNTDDIIDLQNNKQDVLISGENIKTINNESILGTGNIEIDVGSIDYNELENKPKINNVELKGNKTLNNLGIQPAGNYALESEIPDVSNFITKDVNNLTYYTKTTNMQTAINNAVGTERTERENADTNLQGQIDAITSSSDVKDIVGSYTELQNYDTSTLGNDDIVKVLQDSTHWNAMTYYRWIKSGNSGHWEYIGQEGPYYTKSEVDTFLNDKQNVITSSNKIFSDLVNDTNQTNKFVTTTDITNWNNKGTYSKPSGGIPATDLASAVQTSLGKADKAIQSSDLTNYVTNTDYATSSVGGVLKVSNGDYGITVDEGVLKGTVRTYAQYNSMSSKGLVAKGTLENVITGKGLNISSINSGENINITNLLPNGYTRLEYIESSGTQYIDPSVASSNTIGININYSYSTINSSTNAGICGIYQGNNPRTDSLLITTVSGKTNSDLFFAHRGVIVYGGHTPTANTIYNVKINWRNSGVLDFEEQTTNVGTNNVESGAIHLFGRKAGSSYTYAPSKIYSCQFSDETKMIRNLIPAKRNSDSVIGMYDTVNGVFYENEGTGTFTAGAELDNIPKINFKNEDGYVTNTDYATSQKGGVIKCFNSDGLNINNGTLITSVKTYAQYNSGGNWMFVGKGTLENVITGKGLDLKQLSTFDSTKTQVLKNINGTLTWVDE